MIALIDCGLGNLSSIQNAMTFIGSEARVIREASELSNAEAVILPGVGAFPDGMRQLRSGGWVEALDHFVRQRGIPFLGICLGMQVLADWGHEGEPTPGLGWIHGRVERITPTAPDTRLPHMGWNDVSFSTAGSELGRGLNGRDTFYFMHSFSLRTQDPEVVGGTTDHGGPVVACIAKKSIWATQFHPEKSQRAGLQVLRNFVDRVKGVL